MKFKLKKCLGRYSKEKFDNLDVYRKYGFDFDYDKTYDEYVIKGDPYVEITSIEQLIEMSKEFKNDLIVSKNKVIKIYDGWIE